MYVIEQINRVGLYSETNTRDNTNIPLQSVDVKAAFHNLFCQTTITQTYLNSEPNPIEAVYTFPLSARAVLLNLEVKIGKRELQGLIVEKKLAEEQYEDAITNGNTAIMLEQLQTGMYTMNVGNILAREEVSISIIYAELYTWQGESLRYILPTTIAPRYGNPEEAGLELHQIPEHNMISENRFQLEMTISGPLAKAEFECSSHNISISNSHQKTTIDLATGKACMDRDFILHIRQPQENRDCTLVEHAPNGQFVALASFVPRLPLPERIPPKNIKIVVDCSGSMNGDSIAQARQAISDILSQLRAEDFFNLIAFGNSSKTLFKQQVPANRTNLTAARRTLRNIDADMGGTDIQQALETTIQIPGPTIPPDILLITDGEVWDSGEIITMAHKSGHRFFTVGVGSSVSENFVRQLADKTGGACELVAPREQMADKIVRHFKRIYLPRAHKVVINWPNSPKKIIPQSIDKLFAGDTLHAFAFFDEMPKGSVTLEMVLANGQNFSQSTTIETLTNSTPDSIVPGPIARIATHHSLAEMEEDEARRLAVQYQLMSPHTNFLVVDERSSKDRAEKLPLLRKVPQTLAAGWGGTGSVLSECTTDYEIPSFSRASRQSVPKEEIRFSRRPDPEQAHKLRQQTTPAEFIQKCNQLHPKRFRQDLEIKEFADLQGCNLPDRILAAIAEVSNDFDSDLTENIIVPAFLLALSQSAAGRNFSRKTLKAIRKTEKNLPATKVKCLVELFIDILAKINDDSWGPDLTEEF
ncbi:MAG: VIT and VWA domain-containing protein [Pseudomonadota bacterium]|nr:VIT and VWA domain-containing protein [Pseudomonadota bacterium]